MRYETCKRINEGLTESKFKFLSPKRLQIIKAVIIYKDFSGSKFGPGSRSCTIAISEELANELDKMGLPYKKFEVTDENGNPLEGGTVYAIQAKVRYSNRFGTPLAYPPRISFINKNKTEVILSEETVGTLDHSRLERCCFTLNAYTIKDTNRVAWSVNQFKSVLVPYVEFDGEFDEFETPDENADYPGADDEVESPEVDDGQSPF